MVAMVASVSMHQDARGHTVNALWQLSSGSNQSDSSQKAEDESLASSSESLDE